MKGAAMSDHEQTLRRLHDWPAPTGEDGELSAMGADMIPQHRLRHRQGRFGRSEAHCACGAQSPATTPEGVSDWYREHLALIASPIPSKAALDDLLAFPLPEVTK